MNQLFGDATMLVAGIAGITTLRFKIGTTTKFKWLTAGISVTVLGGIVRLLMLG